MTILDRKWKILIKDRKVFYKGDCIVEGTTVIDETHTQFILADLKEPINGKNTVFCETKELTIK